jgi:hypothetical protein
MEEATILSNKEITVPDKQNYLRVVFNVASFHRIFSGNFDYRIFYFVC